MLRDTAFLWGVGRQETFGYGDVIRSRVPHVAGLFPGMGRHLGAFLPARRCGIRLRLVEQQAELSIQLLLRLPAGRAKLFPLQQAQLFHEATILLCRDPLCLLAVSRPLEASLLQPLDLSAGEPKWELRASDGLRREDREGHQSLKEKYGGEDKNDV